MKKRKTNNRRAKQRAKFVRDLNQSVLDELARLSEGLTPPQRVQAHVEYYERCDNAKKLILLEIFKKEADKESTELCEFFAEKYYEN